MEQKNHNTITVNVYDVLNHSLNNLYKRKQQKLNT